MRWLFYHLLEKKKNPRKKVKYPNHPSSLKLYLTTNLLFTPSYYHALVMELYVQYHPAIQYKEQLQKHMQIFSALHILTLLLLYESRMYNLHQGGRVRVGV
eukprot:13469306-Ditylum_brightwellii.AAC.1